MHSRRGLLIAAGGGALLAGCGGTDEEKRERRARTAADLEILRFLLDLERVTTAFWEEVAAGDVLRDDPAANRLAADVARNERTHVDTLEQLLRRRGHDDATAPAPQTRFATVFAAGPRETLRTGAALTGLGAAAYLGQSNRVQDRNLLASVLAIHSVEGRQAAAVARQAGTLADAFADGAFAEPLSMARVRAQLERYTT